MPILTKTKSAGKKGIITFGGAFSNHLHAAAYGCAQEGLQSVGIVRGTWANPDNNTLRFVQEQGMELHFVSATDYALGEQSPDIQAIVQQYPDYEVVPEGGCSAEGIRGCIGLGLEILEQLGLAGIRPETHAIYIALPVGSGSTAAGMLYGLSGKGIRTLLFPATDKGMSKEFVLSNFAKADLPEVHDFELMSGYDFGGFGRMTPILHHFIEQVFVETGIMFDPVYTSKMMRGVFDLLRNGYFPDRAVVVGVHTGGMQGLSR
jgi:1-aminocyclopropane-1-carboxylate deaminase